MIELRINNSDYNDLSKIILELDSRLLSLEQPLNDINHCNTLRFLSKFPITLPYNKNNSNKSTTTTLYKN